MATEAVLTQITLPANDDMSADQYKFAIVNSDSEADLAGANVMCVGVIQSVQGSEVGSAVAVAIGGKTKVKLGGTVVAGAVVTSNASGLAVTATTGQTCNGICIKGGASGEVGEMQIAKFYVP